jgi:uncharacterized protein (TIGR03790 family)
MKFLLSCACGLLLLLAICSTLFALTPAEVLVIANRNAPGSVELAEYYLAKRDIPAQNLLALRLSTGETCTRKEYDEKVAQPVRSFLRKNPATPPIRCLVTIYGMPLKISPPEMNGDEKKQLAVLRDKEKAFREQKEKLGEDEPDKAKEIDGELKALRTEMAVVRKTDHGAALDSELSLVLQNDYPLKGWVPNPFFVGFRGQSLPLGRENTLLVSRLDGPSTDIVRRMIDDSLATEAKGLTGTACFDARWAKPSGEKAKDLQGYALYDHSIHQAAERVEKSGRLPVVLDDKSALFQPGQCPDAALYVGWHSLRKYIDAFTWKQGAVGYHIASFECETLRKEGSNVWCKRMLEEGVAATVGPVAEPYVQAFPVPELFFGLLLEGPLSLVETYFLSLPFLSWQMVLLGDPLYRPFKNRESKPAAG